MIELVNAKQVTKYLFLTKSYYVLAHLLKQNKNVLIFDIHNYTAIRNVELGKKQDDNTLNIQ